MPFRRAIFLLGVLITPSFAFANNDTKNDKGIFDLELFSLSKHEEDAFDAPAAVYILTSEDLRRSGAVSLPEALRMVPGLQVAQQGAHKWTIGSRGFGFQFTNNLLVLIDGRTIYTPQFSGIVWDDHDVPLEHIEKIEVIRGPGATVWGANAVNGVINIITKSAVVTQGNYASASISSNQDRALSVRQGGKINDNGFYRVYAKRTSWGSYDTSADKDAHDDWNNTQAGFRTDWELEANKKLTVEADIKKGTSDNYFSVVPTTIAPFSAIEPHAKDMFGFNIISKLNQVYASGASSTLQVYIDYIEDHTEIVDRDGTTFDLDYQHVSDLNERHQLTWGVGYRYIMDEITPDNIILDYRINNRYNSLYSSFIQDKFALIPERMFLTAGTKIEHNDYTGFELEPSVKLSYFPDDKQTIWGSITRAVRTPSRGEYDATLRIIGTPGGYVARMGGPNFDSEKLIAYELGYRWRPHDSVVMEATTFYNIYTQLRTFESGILPPFGNVSNPLTIANNGTGETNGIELNSKWQITDNFRLQADYTFTNLNLQRQNGSNDSVFELTEGQTPQHQFGLHSFYNILPSLEFDFNFYFVDNLPSAGIRGIDAYTRTDLRLGWRPNDQIEVSLLANNLFMPKHSEFLPALYSPATEVPRTVFLKVGLEF